MNISVRVTILLQFISVTYVKKWEILLKIPNTLKPFGGADIKLKANYSKPIKMAVTFIIELPYVLASFFFVDRCYLNWRIVSLFK